jgi:hypothetical protein
MKLHIIELKANKINIHKLEYRAILYNIDIDIKNPPVKYFKIIVRNNIKDNSNL